MNPFENYTHRTIQIKGDHLLLGFNLGACTTRNIPQIVDCAKSAPATPIPQWRTELKNGYIIAVDNNKVTTIDQVKDQMTKVRGKGCTKIDIQIAIFAKIAMHCQQGIPQLYHDQMKNMGQLLWDIKNNPEWKQDVNAAIIQPRILTLK